MDRPLTIQPVHNDIECGQPNVSQAPYWFHYQVFSKTGHPCYAVSRISDVVSARRGGIISTSISHIFLKIICAEIGSPAHKNQGTCAKFVYREIGTMPVVCTEFHYGNPVTVSNTHRLRYTTPALFHTGESMPDRSKEKEPGWNKQSSSSSSSMSNLVWVAVAILTALSLLIGCTLVSRRRTQRSVELATEPPKPVEPTSSSV